MTVNTNNPAPEAGSAPEAGTAPADGTQPSSPDTAAQGGENPGADAPSSPEAPVVPGEDGANGEQQPEAKPNEGDPESGDENSNDAEKGEVEYSIPEPPEGLTNNDALVADFTALAKEEGFTQEQVNKLVALNNKHNYEAVQNAQAAQAEREQEWEDSLRGDWKGNTYDANMDVAISAFKTTASEELKELLQQGNMYQHPAVVKHFHAIGKTMSEHGLVTSGGSGGKPKTAAEVLFAGLNK